MGHDQALDKSLCLQVALSVHQQSTMRRLPAGSCWPFPLGSVVGLHACSPVHSLEPSLAEGQREAELPSPAQPAPADPQAVLPTCECQIKSLFF